MDRNYRYLDRRRYLKTSSVISLVGLAGCLGDSDEPADGDSGSLLQDGPLQVTDTTRLDARGQIVRVAVDVENTGEDARQTELVVELSHTEADGSISQRRRLLLPAETGRTITFAFEPMFVGEGSSGWPEKGEFQFDPRFEDVEIVEDHPGLPDVTERSAISGGRAWPSSRYDSGATAHNPETTAPKEKPSTVWTASDVEHAFGASGAVISDGMVYAGRPVRAVSVDGGSSQWEHAEAPRVSRLAVGDGLVVFGTTSDLRAVDAENGNLRWAVSSSGDNWGQPATIADGRVYSSDDELYAFDAASGEVDWSVDTSGSLKGPPPVADGIVLEGTDPLKALDEADGTVRWQVSGGKPVISASVAYDTVFTLDENFLTAFDLETGRTRWYTAGPFQAEQIAVGNGMVYVQKARAYELVAVDAETGATTWSCGETDGMLGAPTATSEVVVVPSEQGTLYGIDVQTGDLHWSLSVSMSRPGSVPVAEGVIYFNEAGGPLRALAAEG